MASGDVAYLDNPASVAYLDNAATTRMRPEALEALVATTARCYGNPSGAHRLAREARRVLDDARDVMAAALGCEPGQIVFTAGGTEADNLAVLGVHDRRGGVAVCSAIEHHAVLHATEHVGGRVVGVRADGRIDLDQLADSLDADVSIVSVMGANNESGIIQPLAQVAELVRERAPGAVLHTDAVQAFPWLDVADQATPADLIAVSAHKFGGPKGVGALVVRAGVELDPQLIGGGQERDLRSGTQNVAGIAAMAAAAAATVATRSDVVARIGTQRDRLADTLLAEVPDTVESGNRADKVAGSCHLCFAGIESEALLFLLERSDLMASAASSCASGAQDPSHVLAAMGYDRELAKGSLRLSLGYDTTDADIDRALEVVPPAVAQLRSAGR
jgi:cysteine desulfurase